MSNEEDDAVPAPREWKDAVRARMAERGISHRALAKTIGASQAGISQALSNAQRTSKFVVPISQALELPVPLRARHYLVVRDLERENPAFLEAEVRIMEQQLELDRTKAGNLAPPSRKK